MAGPLVSAGTYGVRQASHSGDARLTLVAVTVGGFVIHRSSSHADNGIC